ncbi:hypothetical protein [Cohnella faecalis]|uniref:Uncharacterized protein n=1 Tax=Cohnella faecalis TaxID=2315694 RepID=A0A398D2U3_9BACL|nr:hypothetical protein [Cohnella faecalis]RIE05404.1 hypothetical protein D3H35_00510 [Cohnella faecalis]
MELKLLQVAVDDGDLFGHSLDVLCGFLYAESTSWIVFVTVAAWPEMISDRCVTESRRSPSSREERKTRRSNVRKLLDDRRSVNRSESFFLLAATGERLPEIPSAKRWS